MNFIKLSLALSIVSLFVSCGQNTDKKEETTQQDSLAAEMPIIGDLITENFAAGYKGTIDTKYTIELELIKFNDVIGGSYKYEGKNTSLILKGRMEDTGDFTISEYNSEGEITGTFEGKLVGEELNGTWYNKKRTKNMPFSLKRTSIASLQTKTDVLSDAMGQYALTSISGGITETGIFNTYIENNKWKSSSSGIISSQNVVVGIDLEETDIQLLNNIHIEVDDNMNVHVLAGLIELINCPFNASGMDYKVNETDKTKVNEKIAPLSPSTIYIDNQLILLANDHIDLSATLKGNFDVTTSDNIILSYSPAERKFELEIFNKECCNGNILTFEKK